MHKDMRGVVVAVTSAHLGCDIWERMLGGRFDGQRRKQVLTQIMGK
jgi:hypothetical protein